MTSEARSVTFKSNRGASSAGLAAFLAVAALGGGVYYASQRAERRPVVKEDHLAQIAALARVEKDTEWLQRAIRERQAILGMTYREVETAKGQPQFKQRGESLQQTHRAQGGVENWVYEMDGGKISEVLFGSNGLVIYASDVADKHGDGHAIRK
jgi:uncharacterized protein HemX